MKKINTVILDIGKVLVDFNWELFLANCGYVDELKKELGKIIFLNDVWKERDRGDKTEEEYIELFIQQAPHLESEIRFIFSNIRQIVREYPFSEEWVKSIKEQGKQVYLLSNYSRTNFEHDMNIFKFIKYTDGGVISYEVNHIKPETQIYQSLIEKYHINPEEAVFLDDLEENLKSARKFGFHTIHVTSHDKAVEGLRELGIYE